MGEINGNISLSSTSTYPIFEIKVFFYISINEVEGVGGIQQ